MSTIQEKVRNDFHNFDYNDSNNVNYRFFRMFLNGEYDGNGNGLQVLLERNRDFIRGLLKSLRCLLRPRSDRLSFRNYIQMTAADYCCSIYHAQKAILEAFKHHQLDLEKFNSKLADIAIDNFTDEEEVQS